VALVDEITAGAQVALDTNALIYYVEEHPQYLDTIGPVFGAIGGGLAIGHVATVTYMEVLVGPLRDGIAALADAYRGIFFSRRDFILHPMTAAIAARAASIRAHFSLRTPDGIVIATALEHECSFLITNDPVFKRVDGLEVLVIDDFV
jgi:predicted nucleic acid-binding protein